MQKSRTATGNDSFGHSSASSVQSVFDTEFLIFQFRFRSGTNFDNGNTAREFSQTFLKFFLVELGSRFRNLGTDGSNTVSNGLFVTSTINDGSKVLGYTDLAAGTKISNCSAVELTANFFTDNRRTRQGCNILKHSLATITKARSLDGNSLKGATESVHNECSQGFTFDIFSNDQEFTALLYHFFKNRHDVLDHSDFTVRNEDVRIGKNGFHLVRIRNHIRGNIAAVELHPFNGFKGGFHGLGFFNGDDAIVADFFHSISNQATDFRVTSRNGSNLCFFFLGADRLGIFLELLDEAVRCFLDASLEDHGVSTGNHVLHAFMNDGLSKKGSRRGPVTSNIVGLGCHFTNKSSPHVFKRIFQFNVLSNGYTIIGDGRGTEFLFKDNVAALGPQGNFYSISQFIDAAFQTTTCFFIKLNEFSHFYLLLSSK